MAPRCAIHFYLWDTVPLQGNLPLGGSCLVREEWETLKDILPTFAIVPNDFFSFLDEPLGLEDDMESALESLPDWLNIGLSPTMVTPAAKGVVTGGINAAVRENHNFMVKIEL